MADHDRFGGIIATGRLIKPGRAVVLSNRPRSRSHLAAVLGQHLRPFGSMDGFLIGKLTCKSIAPHGLSG